VAASGSIGVNMKISLKILARLWYYFRMGYSTYLTFLLGYVSTLVTVYYLAIKNLPTLLDLFPHFAGFAVLATAIGVPLSVGIGWLHLKRTIVYSSEAEVAAEANPYTYKLSPGLWSEAFAPLYLELLVQQKKLLEAQKLLDEDDRARIQAIETKMRILLKGGYVGVPRRKF